MNKDSLFSDGGENAHFSKKGKEWKDMRHLMAHVTRIIQCGNEDVYRNCSIVECELIEIKKYDITSIIEKKKSELLEREELEEARRQKRKTQEERKLFKELSKKFEK